MHWIWVTVTSIYSKIINSADYYIFNNSGDLKMAWICRNMSGRKYSGCDKKSCTSLAVHPHKPHTRRQPDRWLFPNPVPLFIYPYGWKEIFLVNSQLYAGHLCSFLSHLLSITGQFYGPNKYYPLTLFNLMP